MSADPTNATAIAELANALQVAAPTAARLQERADALAQDAERLTIAIERAATAIRTLQPKQDGR
jgi:hypothetical protein